MMYMLAIVVVFVIVTMIRFRTRVHTVGHWRVIADNDSAETAALLSRVHGRMLILLSHLKKKYHIGEPRDVVLAEGADHPSSTEWTVRIEKMLYGYNPQVISEVERRPGSSSYTINKGEAMMICTRAGGPADGDLGLVDDNTMFFVILHEASHIANYDGLNHEPKFWNVFAFMLREAVECGAYKPVDYSLHPVGYCGIKIEFNPMFGGL